MEPRHSQGEVGEVHRHQEEAEVGEAQSRQEPAEAAGVVEALRLTGGEEEEAEERVALSSLEEEGEVMVEHSLKGEEAEEAEEARH